MAFTKPTRWIAHDGNKHFAGEFDNEEEARRCVENWNTKGGNLVTLEWVAPPEDADDSNRGTYIIRLTGTRFRITICNGWHSQELAGERLKLLRNAVAKYGFTTVSEILFAAQTQLTEYGWTADCKPNNDSTTPR